MNNVTKEILNDLFLYSDGELVWKKSIAPRAMAGIVTGKVLTSHGYKSVELFGKAHKTHQLIYMMFHGYCPKEIDHINGDRSDNRIENLRHVTRSQNCANQKTQQRSLSGFKGVTLLSKKNLWRARIKANQKEIYLGCFANKEDAAQAYNKAALEHFGTFAKLNELGASN